MPSSGSAHADIDLLPHGPSVVKADVLSTDNMHVQFSRLFDSTSRVQASEARQELVDCLSGQAADGPFLIVLDELETVRDPVQLYSFLR